MSTHYASVPNTPPRRIGHRSRLTPSSTPFITPTKSLYSSTKPSTARSYRKISNLPSFQSQLSHISSSTVGTTKTPIRNRTTHQQQNCTPYFTPSEGLTNTDDTSSKNVPYDRYIPSRYNMDLSLSRRSVLTGEKRKIYDCNNKDETPLQKEYKRRMLSTLCNVPLYKLDDNAEPTGIFSFGGIQQLQNGIENQYTTSQTGMARVNNPYSLDVLRSMKLGTDTELDAATQQSVASKIIRKVPSAPVRILDAPDIVDDYYLNLISWSKDNILAVALARSVYLWNASSGEISHLISVEGNDYITSVRWCSEPGNTKYICVGSHLNEVHVFDGQTLSKMRTMKGATGRIASLSWRQHMISAGDRDGYIINHDVRAQTHIVSKYKGHTQEVCGLAWNDDGSCLASGGNENFLCLWDAAMSNRNGNQRNSIGGNYHRPRQTLKQHKAAVKALDWCPFHRGLLASGGGTADRKINFWNSSSGALLNSVDTGSQVCSIIWSKHQRELCSSHGYSENQLILWKYPNMIKMKELTGHTARVLNMDISPDGSSIVSAGADETLRFWNIFDTPSTQSSSDFGELSIGGRIR
jgi:cell division cycle 20, cofactor of APC complex